MEVDKNTVDVELENSKIDSTLGTTCGLTAWTDLETSGLTNDNMEFNESSFNMAAESGDMEFVNSSLGIIVEAAENQDVKMDAEDKVQNELKDEDVDAGDKADAKKNDHHEIKEDVNVEKNEVLEEAVNEEFKDLNTFLKVNEKKLEDMHIEIDQTIVKIVKSHVDLVDKLQKQEEEFQRKYDNVKNMLDNVAQKLKEIMGN